MLGGIYSLDEGEIEIEGKKVSIESVHDASKNNIAIIHQELVFGAVYDSGGKYIFWVENREKDLL